MVEKIQVALSEHELSELRVLVEQRSGILFDDSRQRFFPPRVREYMEEKKFSHGAELIRTLKGSNVEYDKFLERLLTQETSFMRYPAIFNALAKKVLPEIHMKKFWENPRALRVWSAGCSTGEEPYTIALTIADSIEFAEAWNIEILATDISKSALTFAEKGVYPRRELHTLTPKQFESYFQQVGPDEFKVRPKLRNMVKFAPLNLAQAVYMGKFDFIFCMNVLIYFSEERRAALVQRFFDYLEPGGYLFLGHAESMAKTGAGFEPIVVGDSLIYQKPANASMRAVASQERF
jgi:chemotaxis protein methyltransferase CheR